MAKKKSSLKFSFDAPVSFVFTVLSIIFFVVDIFIHQKLNSSILITPTSPKGDFPFSFTNALSYLRLFLFMFGGVDKVKLFANLIFIMLIGPKMEERYGSVIIGIMTFVAALFTSVLYACFCNYPFGGADSIVFMLIILDILMNLTKKTISLSSIAVIGVFIAWECFSNNPNGFVGVASNIAGGICGSLLAFLASPRRKQSASEETKKSKKSTEKSDDKDDSDSDETVVGTLHF